MVVIILIAVLFYLSVLTTLINYFVRIRKYDDVVKRLKFAGKTIGVICLEQALALFAVVAFYVIKLKDKQVDVPDWWAILSAVIDFGGFVAALVFWHFHKRKYFPKYEAVNVEKWRRRRDNLHEMTTVFAGMAFVNFGFNLFIGGAVAYLI